MRFFLEFIRTRIRERGWPRRKGFLRLRRYVTEEAVVFAMQDAIRVALALGAYLPGAGRRVAATYVDAIATAEDQVRESDVDAWVSRASELGACKYDPEIRPGWLSMCSLIVADGPGHEGVVPWYGSQDEFLINSPETFDLLATAAACAGTAMAWAMEHRDAAIRCLSDDPRFPDFLRDTAGWGWKHMAEAMVTEYEAKVGFPRITP